MAGSHILKQPFIDHLKELRARFLWSSLFLIIGTVIGYFLYNRILSLLIAPLNKPLYYTSPTGGFDFVLKICIFFGLLFSLPVFIFNLLLFVAPAISKNIKHLIPLILLSSLVLLCLGISFAYFVSLPAAFYFLNKFGSDQIQSLITTNEYFTFVTRYLLGFGLLFQLPLILLFINWIDPLSMKKLFSFQKIVIVLSFVVAAILTPTPDLFNQSIMAIPLIGLYEISILVILVVNRKKLT